MNEKFNFTNNKVYKKKNTTTIIKMFLKIVDALAIFSDESQLIASQCI
jgi:hypothetical protein